MLKKSLVSLFVTSALVSGCGSSDDNEPQVEVKNTASTLSTNFTPVIEKFRVDAISICER